jgi:hypothetical protein
MTAEEFLEHISENGKYTFDWKEFGILFAKYHVEQALKEASQTKLEANYDNTGIDEERYPNDKSLILNAYPLENIK